MASRGFGIASLTAAALAIGAAGGHAAEQHVVPALRKRDRKRGSMPKPSKPMSQEYILTVRAQRGFTTRRLESLKRSWEADCRNKVSADRTPWWKWIEEHRRKDDPLESHFDIMTPA